MFIDVSGEDGVRAGEGRGRTRVEALGLIVFNYLLQCRSKTQANVRHKA